jgi:Bacterial Ig-like domain (group 2)
VLVTGPTAATLKINEGTAFTAVAKDSSGTALAGKVFTWSSSDTNIATVDTGGVVTAKRIGTVKISATTDSVTGEGAAQTTFGLEIAGGVFKDPALLGAVTGTSFIAKIRLADGTNPATGSITVTGPSGWNTVGTPVSLSYTATNWGINYFFRGLIPVINGKYEATAVVNAVNFSANFEIDTNAITELATGITVTNAKTTQADVSWTGPAGAGGYVVMIWQDNGAATDTIVTNANFKTPSSSQQFRSITLDPAKQYYVEVRSSNAAWTPDNATIPTQFNLTRARSAKFSPTP